MGVRTEPRVRRRLRCALLVALLTLSGCSTSDPESARAELHRHFGRDVPPGYQCKYAFSVGGRRYATSLVIAAPKDVRLAELDSALQHKTVLLFHEARVYTVPGEEDDAEIEAVLWRTLDSKGHGVRLGEEMASGDASISVGGEAVQAKKILTVREDGTRLVRYRVPIGREQILVAVGPESALDLDAIAALRPAPPPEKRKQWLGWGVLAVVCILWWLLRDAEPKKKGAR